MRKPLKEVVKPLGMNVQFIRAFEWLRSNEGVKNADRLAELLHTSPTTVSGIMNFKIEVNEKYAYRMNVLLEKHALSLKDFDKDYLNKQAGFAGKIKREEFESLLLTKVTEIEAYLEVILDVLNIITDGELLSHKKFTKIKKIKSTDK